MHDAGRLVERVTAMDPGRQAFRVLGPAPAPLAKLRGEYRAQFLVKGTRRKPMRDALLKVLDERPEIARRTTVDVDPVSVL
jgi:primosomal protein N' (replication factor Y)